MKAYYEDQLTTLYQGHVLDVLAGLPEASVQCCVTSPPYWGLRKYAGEQVQAWPDGSTCAYGLETTIAMYVQHTVEVLRAIRRVLRPDGVVWWNVGDSYAHNGACGGGSPVDSRKPEYGRKGYDTDHHKGRDTDREAQEAMRYRVTDGLKPKDLCLIPSRVALAAQEAGWWVRSMIVWSKLNPMPESVTDRPTDAYEHIIMLTKSQRYYYDAEAVKEAVAESTIGRSPSDFGGRKGREATFAKGDPNYRGGAGQWGRRFDYRESCTNGRNLRNVWTLATQSYKQAHFAVFPEAIPDRCIRAASKEGDTVLDPFAGSGTTLAVAKFLGRRAIGIELSEEYCDLAVRRIQAVTAPLPVMQLDTEPKHEAVTLPMIEVLGGSL